MFLPNQNMFWSLFLLQARYVYYKLRYTLTTLQSHIKPSSHIILVDTCPNSYHFYILDLGSFSSLSVKSRVQLVGGETEGAVILTIVLSNVSHSWNMHELWI